MQKLQQVKRAKHETNEKYHNVPPIEHQSGTTVNTILNQFAYPFLCLWMQEEYQMNIN